MMPSIKFDFGETLLEDGTVIQRLGATLLQFEDECQNATCRLIESNLGVGTWSLDPATDRSYWSRGFYELLGLDPGTVSPSYEEFDRRVHRSLSEAPTESFAARGLVAQSRSSHYQTKWSSALDFQSDPVVA